MHAPLPAAALSTPLPVSRTSSPAPQRTPSSAPSKVEKLLRDTLRRDRAASSSRTATPVSSAPYYAHDVFIADCCSQDDDDDDAMPPYELARAASHTARPAPVALALDPPPSPSPQGRAQRPPRSPLGGHRPSHSMSSAPVLRHPTPLRPPGVPASSRSDPACRTVSPAPSSRSNAPLMPHEAALRSRLQGMLDANPTPPHVSKATSALRAVSGPNHATSARRNHSRARSVSSRTDGDTAWWGGPHHASPGFATQPTVGLARVLVRGIYADLPPQSPTTASYPYHNPQRSPSLTSLGFFPTPPSTPPSPSLELDPPAADRPSFDVRTASQLCRNAPGLVSFKDVEGLGAPPDMDDQDGADDTPSKGGRWWDLYSWSPFKRGSAEKPGVSSSA
ncbi:hypothetical protein AURDEDRAFT_119299 [Auricularia subglabra TFB-10046 SS5]|nr:hypothetical protein AURDEDRAFT_119299 [Auricularia subglabra TFB-10046 SS5]